MTLSELFYMRNLYIVLAIILVVLVVLFLWSENNSDEQYCSQFSYENCPTNRCVVGGSCPVCADIGCHPIGYNKDWPE